MGLPMPVGHRSAAPADRTPPQGPWGGLGPQLHVPAAASALPSRRSQREQSRRSTSGRRPRRRLLARVAVLVVLVGGGAGVAVAQLRGPSTGARTTGAPVPSGTPGASQVAGADQAMERAASREFVPRVAGSVVGVKLVRPADSGTRYDGGLWTADGKLLARAEFPRTAGQGWRTARFVKPVPVTAGAHYVASFWRHGAKPAPPARRSPSGHRATGPATGATGSAPAPSPDATPTVGGSGAPSTGVPTAVPPPSAAPPVDVVFDPAPTATAGTTTRQPSSSASSPSSPSASPAGSPAPGAANPAGSATGCLAHPSSCGYPDASTTGVPKGVTLTAYTGSRDITKAGTVIDGKLITGALTIRANNVTIKRSKVVMSGSGCTDCSVIRVFEGYTGAVVQDVEVDGRNSCGIAVELAGDGGVAQRVNAYGCSDFYRANDGTQILDSYGHDRWAPSGAHSDGIQSLGTSNLTYRHNTLVLPGDSGVNALIMIGNEYGRSNNVKIQNNLLDGGGYTIRLMPGSSGVVISGNRFGRDYSYGPIYATSSDYSWTGNVWDLSGAAVAD